MSSSKRKHSDHGGPRSRQQLIRVACNECRRRKLRCSGERPSCSACVGASLECQYDTANPSESRIAALRRENTVLRGELADMHTAASQSQDSTQIGFDDFWNIEASTTSPISSTSSLSNGPLPPSDPTNIGSSHAGSLTESLAGPVPESLPSTDFPEQRRQSNSGLVFNYNPPSGHNMPYPNPYLSLLPLAPAQSREERATALLEALATTSDSESTMILANLRVGHHWEDVAARVLRMPEGSESGQSTLQPQDPPDPPPSDDSKS